MNLIDFLQWVTRRRIRRATRIALSRESHRTSRTPKSEAPNGQEMVSLGIAVDGTELVLPIEALWSHGLILGATGAGKSCAASVIIAAFIKTFKSMTKFGIGVVDLKGDLYHLGRSLVKTISTNVPIEFLDLNGPRAIIPYDLLTTHDDETPQELLSRRMGTFSDILGQEGQLSLRMIRMFKYKLSLLIEHELPFALLDELLELEGAPGALAERSRDERVKRYFSGDFITERSITLPALRYRLDHLLAPECIRLSLSAGYRINFLRTMDAGGLSFINLGGAGPHASRVIQSLTLSDITHDTFKRQERQANFLWLIDEAHILFERSSDRENLLRMLRMSRSFNVNLGLITQSLRAAIRDSDFYQTLETNFRWVLLMRSGLSDAAIIRPALRATGMVRRGLDHSGRPVYLTPEQEIQRTLQEIVDLSQRHAYFWIRGEDTNARKFTVHALKTPKNQPATDEDARRDIAKRARAHVEAARTKLAEIMRSRPASGDVGTFLSRIDRMRKKDE
jgi:hypothetical protein